MRKLTFLFAALLSLSWGTMKAQDALPYSYGFESASVTADGWTKTSCHGSTENHNLGVASGHGGSYVFRFYYNATPPQYLISPELATSDKAIDVSFVYRAQSTSYEESFQVGYSTTDTETASFTFGDEVKTKSTTWTEYTTTLPAGTKYVCIAYTANDKYYLYIDDFYVEAAGALAKPKSLGASDITANSATLNWTAGGNETSWEISYSTSSDVPAAEGSYTSVNSTTYSLTGLSAQTTYYVYVRAKVGDEYSAWSEVCSFTTTQVAVAAEGYTDDFETACNWMLINGSMTNTWAWGSAINNGGEKALYISNDGGTTNAYGTGATTVYASKLFSFEGGTYNFTYDWICKGEKSSYGSSVYDYLRVALVPTDATLTAGANAPTGFSGTGLPTGWIALDGGALVDVTEWQHKSEAVAVEAGNYYVVFCWRNDGSGGANPPAAIDNFSIAMQTCPVPTNLTVSDIAARMATLSWATSNNTWEVYCTTEEGTPAADVEVTATDIATNSYTFTGLTPETKYYVWVRSVSGSDKSEWTGTDFTTDISCHAPTGLTVAGITSTGATLSWTSDADDFNVRYKKVSDEDWTLVEGTISAKTYVLIGLTPATAYQVQVRTYCDAADQSAWTDAASFTTDCAAIAEFPFTESFNGITAGIPDCWNNTDGTTNTINYRWSYYATGHDGACLRFNSYNNANGNTNMLKTPAMNLPTGKIMQLTFWYKNPAGGDFSVFISNDGGTTYTTELATGLTGASAWTQKEIVLPADFTENVVIVFQGTSNYANGDAYIYLDDVTIDEAPACAKPTALTVSNVTINSVELSWTNGSDEEAWQIAYGTTADFDADEATPVDVTTNPYTLTGLAANTTYYVCVRAKKGSDVSDWSDKVNFATEPSCITPTDFAVSATTINSATLTWTDATEQSKWEVSYSTTSGAPEEGTIVAVTEKTYTIEGLTAGTTYYASVRAVNSDDDKSAWSSEVSFIPGVVIANEGTTTNGNVPLYGYDADTANGTQCQLIIPATSLTSVAGNQIDKIAFYSSYATRDWGSATFDVYVKEVENTAFENTTLVDWTTMTKVYSGKLSVNDSQMVIEFEEPFAYEGGNLMIGVNQTAKGKYLIASWYGVATSDYSALQKGSRYQFLPKTAFYYSPIVVAPKMEVSETELAYGLVAPNSVQTKTFTIENKGKADLTGITVSSDNAAFTVTEVQNQTIAAGGEAITVTVTLNTETAGEYDGTITISATDQEDAEIAVSGIVRNADKLFIDFAENPMPETWSMASGWSVSNEMAYNNGTEANITSGEVVVAEGGENIFFDYKGANAWGETYDYVKVYYATTGNDSEADWTLIDGATFGCTDNTTWHQAKVTIPAAAKYIRLQGKYIYIDNFYGLSKPSGAFFAINTDGSEQNFGFLEQDAVAEKSYEITNSGNADMKVTIAAPEGFGIAGANTLKFTNSNNWGVVYVHLWGGGNDTTWPGVQAAYLGQNELNQAQFSIVIPEGTEGLVINDGGYGQQTTDITNFDVEGYYLTGSFDNGKCNVASWGTTPVVLTTTIAAGASKSFTVQMNTASAGVKSGNVVLKTNALNTTEFTIPVSGYVVDDSKILVNFDNNQLPEKWNNVSNLWTFDNGMATAKSSSSQLITPLLRFSAGDVVAIKAQCTDSDTSDYLRIYGSDDNGSTWTAYDKKINGGSGLALLKDGWGAIVLTDIPTTVTVLKFVGYYVNIDEIAGLTYAPVLEVDKEGQGFASPAYHHFGECSADADVTFNFTNYGGGTITITNVAITGEGAAAYSTNWTESVDVPFDLVITRTYNAERVGVSEAVVTVTTTEGDFVINVDGSDKGLNAPELAVSPTEDANFGVVTEAVGKTYTVTNAGTGLLSVDIASDNEMFAVSAESLENIAAGESRTFDVTFTPVAEIYGTFIANITVTPTYDKEAVATIVASATVKDPNVWSEDFSAGVAPTGWDAGANWSFTNGVAKAAYAYGTTNYLTTPALTVVDAKEELNFDYNATANYVNIKIQMSKDGGAFADYQTISGLNKDDAGTYTITGLEAGDYQFRFANDDYELDNFEGFKLNLPDHIMAITASDIPTSSSYSPTMKATKSFNATVTVKETRGVDEENVIAKLYMGEEVIGTSEAVAVEAGATKQITIVATPTAAAPEGAQMYIEVEYAGGTLTTEPVTRYVAEYVTLALTETEGQEITTGYDAVYDLVTLTRNFAAGWNTFVAPQAVSMSEFGEGAKAYSFTGFANSTLSFSVVTTETLSPATPYIIYVPEKIENKVFTWESPVIYSSYVGTDNIKTTQNDAIFQGTYAPMAAGEMTGKYGVTSDGHIRKAGTGASIKGFRAYFDIPAGTEIKAISFDDIEDAISLIQTDAEENDAIYNVAGQRVQKMQKGINIINGKKILK